MNDSISRRPEVVQFGNSDITIRSVIGALFPRGTQLKLVPSDQGNKFTIEYITHDAELEDPPPGADRPSPDLYKKWRRAPPLPPDVFALAAMLLDLSGATHHVADRAPKNWPRNISLSKSDHARIAKVAVDWGNSPQKGKFKVPKYVEDLWTALLKFADQSVFALSHDHAAPAWWLVALKLLVVADEAAYRIGFQDGRPTKDISYLQALFESYLWALPEEPVKPKTKKRLRVSTQHHGTQYTIATVPPDVACVLPKSRTSQVGCTLRSLSHHLALLPPRGKARAYWNVPPNRIPLHKDTEPLNLLLIPHPFQLPPASLEMGEVKEFSELRKDRRWGWFRLNQAWPPQHGKAMEENSLAIVGLVRSLAAQSQKSAGPAHGIVFPEGALDFATFDMLLEKIAGAADDDPLSKVEIVVSGLRTDADGKAGNYAGACVIARVGAEVMIISNVQQKHHRWRIDQRQVNMYGFGSQLASGATWWENIALLSRSLNLFVFRSGSTLAPLICEDLARLEPIHDVVRSVGPSIVIALLLDGPQVTGRWPGRYAMGLADDPGSSVLTLTSLGPVLRAQERSGRESKSIALWRDETGDTREIALDGGASAILLSLSGHRTFEHTIDGRGDGSAARRWVYADHISVPLTPEDAKLYPWAIAP